jgi:hypothetical protein
MWLYPERRQRELEAIVKRAVGRVLAHVAARQPPVVEHFFYGAMGIHPRHLVTWYLFETDADQEAARATGLLDELDARTRAELEAEGFPPEGVAEMMVATTTREDIQRTTGGDYRLYFQ